MKPARPDRKALWGFVLRPVQRVAGSRNFVKGWVAWIYVFFWTGLPSAAIDGHQKMVALLAGIVEKTPQENRYFNEQIVEDLRARIERFTAETPTEKRIASFFELGRQELFLGLEHQAIERLTQAKSLIQEHGGSTSTLNAIRFNLGVAYLRLGETENCCARNNTDSCVLPIQGNGIHTQREGSTQAIVQFRELLESGDTDSELFAISEWLLNLAYMTLGEYPVGVPLQFRIPPSRFQSSETFPRFLNIAPEVGLDTYSQLGGVVFDDFNGDGFLDVMVSSWHPADPLRLFVNTGNRSFEDRTSNCGLDGITGGCNLIQGDYDNDGDPDVYVMRGGWFGDYGKHPNSLLQNDGTGVFRDVSFEAGLGEFGYPSQTAAFADFDLDGDLDLYVGNETSASVDAPCQLFQNNGDGTFVDVAQRAGVLNGKMAKGVVWGDYDGDRYPDLFVSNYGSINRLYHNQGDSTFWDVALEEEVYDPEDSFSAWFWDYNNDSLLDLFVTDYSGKVGDIAKHFKTGSPQSIRDRLYEGLPGGGFSEVSVERKLNRPTFAMGANFGDLNNDGYLDMFLGTGWPDYYQLMPNVMFVNQSGDGFMDVTTQGGFGNLQKGHGVAFADFDNDGDQDVFIQMGGALKGDKYFDILYENSGFDNDWITLKLEGVASNRSAIGTQIHLVVEGEKGERSIYKHVNSGGSFGANPLRQTIGLGKIGRIVRLEIFWPKTGKTQVFENPPKNSFLRITEDKNEWKFGG